MSHSSISQKFISLEKGELSRKLVFGCKVQKGHTKGHIGQGQFGLADEKVANDPRYHHAKLYTSTSLCIILWLKGSTTTLTPLSIC